MRRVGVYFSAAPNVAWRDYSFRKSGLREYRLIILKLTDVIAT